MPESRFPYPDVSRETYETLKDLETLALEWTSKINLISKSTEVDFWKRHIIDSIQVFKASDSQENWCDIGSGGGFPGLVIGILQRDLCSDAHLTLIESDKRKCAFLMTVVREFGLNCEVKAHRVEQTLLDRPATISARALAPLDKLLGFMHHLGSSRECGVFPKGKNWKKEVDEAQQKWHFEMSVIQSITDAQAVVLRVTNIEQR